MKSQFTHGFSPTDQMPELGFHGKVLVAREAFCVKLLEAFPDACHIADGPATAQN